MYHEHSLENRYLENSDDIMTRSQADDRGRMVRFPERYEISLFAEASTMVQGPFYSVGARGSFHGGKAARACS